VGASSNGHALQYADGTPFFMIGDTWLAGATWRLPFRNASPPAGMRPHIWDALQYKSGMYMQHLEQFIMSEGGRYQELQPASDHIRPRKAPGSPEDGLDGWAFMMKTPGKNFALLYFENGAVLPELSGFIPGADYELKGFDPMLGTWGEPDQITADGDKIILSTGDQCGRDTPDENLFAMVETARTYGRY